MTKGLTIPTYALTTRERVKDRLQITDDAHDNVIDRFVKSVSDYIRSRTNMNFAMQTYYNEVYSVYGERQPYLLLNQCPVFQLQLINATTVVGSPVISNLTNTNGVKVGMQVIGDNVPAGSSVVSYTANSITLNNNATGASTTAYMVVNGIISMQYRSGLPSNPNWTNYIPDQFELLEEGNSGIVRVYGPLSVGRFTNNSVRITYVAGYLIDWDNENDPTKHDLPGELTMLAENLIVRWWTRRKNAGKLSEGIAGSTVSWDRELSPEDMDVFNWFTRTPRFT